MKPIYFRDMLRYIATSFFNLLSLICYSFGMKMRGVLQKERA